MPILSVTKKHLKRALDAKKSSKWNVIKDCLIGQAAKDLFGDNFRSCSGTEIYKNDGYIYKNSMVAHFIRLFDSKDYNTIENELPVNIELGEPYDRDDRPNS